MKESNSSTLKNDLTEISKRFLKQTIHQIKKGEVTQASLSLKFIEELGNDLVNQAKSLRHVLENSQARMSHKNPRDYPLKQLLNKNGDATVTIVREGDEIRVIFKKINNHKMKKFKFKGLIADEIFEALTYEKVLQLCVQYNQPKKNPYYYEVTA